jgi:hypothetical protein
MPQWVFRISESIYFDRYLTEVVGYLLSLFNQMNMYETEGQSRMTTLSGNINLPKAKMH